MLLAGVCLLSLTLLLFLLGTPLENSLRTPLARQPSLVLIPCGLGLMFGGSMSDLDENETRVALLYGRIIILCLTVLVAFWQLDVDIPVDVVTP